MRRSLDVLSLVLGGLFVSLGIAFALDAADRISVDVSWVWPVVLIALGAGWMATGWARGPSQPPE